MVKTNNGCIPGFRTEVPHIFVSSFTFVLLSSDRLPAILIVRKCYRRFYPFISGCVFGSIHLSIAFALPFAIRCLLTCIPLPLPLEEVGASVGARTLTTRFPEAADTIEVDREDCCFFCLPCLFRGLPAGRVTPRSFALALPPRLLTNAPKSKSLIRLWRRLVTICWMKGCNIAPKSIPPKFNAFFLGPGSDASPIRRPRFGQTKLAEWCGRCQAAPKRHEDNRQRPPPKFRTQTNCPLPRKRKQRSFLLL